VGFRRGPRPSSCLLDERLGIGPQASARGRHAARAVSVRTDERGQAMVEYALILFLVALVAIAILGTLGTTVSSMFSTVISEF
jgi:Flp pilus assembly pilin Flp